MFLHVIHDRIVRVELGWRNATTGENPLLPVASNGSHRTLENALAESFARRRVRPQIDGANRLTVLPTRGFPEKAIGQKFPRCAADGIFWMNDDAIVRHLLR